MPAPNTNAAPTDNAYNGLRYLMASLAFSSQPLTDLEVHITESELLITPHVLSTSERMVAVGQSTTHREQLLLKVDALFTMMAADESSVSLRATGVYLCAGWYATNGEMLMARRIALLSALGVDADPVDKKVVANQALVQAGHAPLVTADTLPANEQPYQPTKAELAQASKALIAWREGIASLPILKPEAFDAHKVAMFKLPGLDAISQKEEFGRLLTHAGQYGLEYNTAAKKFVMVPASGTDNPTYSNPS